MISTGDMGCLPDGACPEKHTACITRKAPMISTGDTGWLPDGACPEKHTACGGIHILTNTWRTINPLFGREASCPIELDLGCGKGALAFAMARRFPDRLILASDVMIGRLRKVLGCVQREGLENMEVIRANSLDLTAYQLPVSSIDRIHVICPDPWPKKRHAARRLLNTDFMRRAARVLKPGGTLHLATDDVPYREFMLEAISNVPCFQLDESGSRIADIADIKTGFELRWNAQGVDVPHYAFCCCT